MFRNYPVGDLVEFGEKSEHCGVDTNDNCTAPFILAVSDQLRICGCTPANASTTGHSLSAQPKQPTRHCVAASTRQRGRASVRTKGKSCVRGGRGLT